MHKHRNNYPDVVVKKANFWSNRTDRPFAVGNTIRTPDWFDDKPEHEYRARMTHELVHIEQQRFSNWYAMYWIPKWLMNKKFRALQEMPAFWAQMECYRDCSGVTVILSVIKNTMVNKYRGAFTEKLADAFIKAFEMKKSIKDWNKFYEENI